MRSETRQAGDSGARYIEPERRPSKREAIIEMCRYIILLRSRGEAQEAERIEDALYAAQPGNREVIEWNLRQP